MAIDVYDGSDYLKRVFPELPYIIEKGIMPTGMKAILFGPPKRGKSIMLNQLALAVANGKEWLGFKTNPKVVLYMNFEIGHKSWQRRLTKLCHGAGVPLNHNLRLVSDLMGTRLDTPLGQAEMEKAVAIHKPQLVILDPFYKTISGSSADEECAMACTDFLDKLIIQYAISVIICHHVRKEKISHSGVVDLGSQEMMGGHLQRWADSIIRLLPVSEDRVRLEFELRHAEEPLVPVNLLLDRKMAGFVVVP